MAEPAGTGDGAIGSRRGLVVELVGIPGAGKSRRARALAGALAGRGIPVTQPQEPMGPSVPAGLRLARKAVACGAAGLARPGTTARALRGLFRSGQPAPGDVAGRAVQLLVAQQVTARGARTGGVAVLDEGPLQALWSTGLRGDVRPVLTALDASAGWQAPGLVVVVRITPELALARLAGRASRHSRTQLLDEEAQLAELRHGEELLDRLVAWWAGQTPAPRPVLEVSGTDDGDVTAEPFLERIVAAQRH